MLVSPAAADKRLFFMFSYAWPFSSCWPPAKEHVRRNRQSRTFLVENVIGEIWSELEEGIASGCLLPLLTIIYFHCLQKMHSHLSHLHLGEMLSGRDFKDHSLRDHPSGSRSSACQKPMQILFPLKIRLPSSGGSCVGVHVTGCGGDTALCDLNALVF